MSLVAAAVCPCPPLLVPAVAAGAAAELDGLREACDAAVAHLLAADAEALLVVGGGERTRRHTFPYRGTFAPFGARADFGPPDGDPLTDLSLLVGGWLLSRHDLGGRTVWFDAVAAGADPGTCARLGAEWAGRRARVALLALGDGSACHGRTAPGYDDPRAEAYRAAVVSALAGADPVALLGLDTTLSAELKAAGRAAWQVLAGAVGGRPGRGAVTYDETPYGVHYAVATWSPA
ncbi:hypothetical protein [Spirilliplanes yamanashiensis]|uniref:Catalytic LigB subunit of aromatic ring-opening dioxygenase n=1 Tax=Spirilliplanes yamanashiensis TaxID=42233 RepID=A0A8J4DI26_9ACTN|nr:hypothetical protein [Spirilliplanes yamanashiensis]MDP9819573.1 hypothetical protein [Spirilliplanes yamanashiensis]GIJ01605.1 hypothetical protein Sya03_09570 [Spirilliplanes yamanashiensis]